MEFQFLLCVVLNSREKDVLPIITVGGVPEDGSGAGGAGPVSGVYTDGVSAQHKRPKLYWTSAFHDFIAKLMIVWIA